MPSLSRLALTLNNAGRRPISTARYPPSLSLLTVAALPKALLIQSRFCIIGPLAYQGLIH